MSNNFERNLFLKSNPEISKLLQNDTSLKKICTKDELKRIDTRNLQIPILYSREDISFDKNIIDIPNYMKFLLQMVVNNKLSEKLAYYNCNFTVDAIESIAQMITKAFELVRSRYIEYFSGIHGVDVQSQMKIMGNTVISFTLYVSFIEHYHGALRDTIDFLKLSNYVVQTLFSYGKLQMNYSQYNKAGILYNWVVLHTTYDTSFSKYSYTGISALKYGTAVCQGFVALYNCLCKICGLQIMGMAGEGRPKNSRKPEKHIWSCAFLDNYYVFIDVTWGSPVFANESVLRKYGLSSEYFCDFLYFNIPYDKLKQEHSWSVEDYGF